MSRFSVAFMVVLLLTGGACRSGEDAEDLPSVGSSAASEESDSPFRNLGKRDETGS